MNVIKEGWQFVLKSPKEEGVDFGHLSCRVSREVHSCVLKG